MLAEELAQETMVRVARDWEKVSRLDAPGAWAYRVAMNLARSHFRRARWPVVWRRACARRRPRR
jgi:DNA-directed RNA polymerase specialized sigma24 family protein